jgi:hypothetical protein
MTWAIHNGDTQQSGYDVFSANGIEVFLTIKDHPIIILPLNLTFRMSNAELYPASTPILYLNITDAPKYTADVDVRPQRDRFVI